MRRVSAPDLALLKDDLPLEPLLAAIETEVQYLQSVPNRQTFTFGERTIPKDQYLAGLKKFVELARATPDRDEFFKRVGKDFEFYEVYGDQTWGDVFMTSYFEPVVPASKKKTKTLTQPLYAQPSDLLAVDLSLFDEKFAGERKYRARVENGKVLPYYSREEIDVKGALKNKKLELFWVDPVDAFTLQVQGSGTLLVARKKGEPEIVRVGYADKNGQRYESVGKFFKGLIPPDQLTWHSIETYLRSLPPAEMQQYLNLNPSYIFFKVMDKPAITYLGVSATEGRTIATDPKYFPKGALGFLVAQKPRFASPKDTVPASWEPLARFVLDQDIGGAITGGGRLDLFWGRGDEAKQHAGVIKQHGNLYYIAPKAE